jgi:hypothetical protein
LDDGNLMMTMGQQQCTLAMTAMKMMADMVTVTATVTAMVTMMAMMPPLPLTATMSMKTTAAI